MLINILICIPGPSGKYIFIHAPFSSRETHIDGYYDENTNSFWDVSNQRKVDLPLSASLFHVRIGNWRGVHTWIDDHLMVGNARYMGAYSPHTKTKQILYSIFSLSGDSSTFMKHEYFGLAYNNKTLQLAAVNEKNIIIWSYFKLPPYKCTHHYIYRDEISYDEFNFPEVALPE